MSEIEAQNNCTKDSANLSKRELQHRAMKEVLVLLNKKSIPCYFFHRVDTMGQDFEYSKKAKIRMSQELTFLKMSEDIQNYEEHFKELIGDKYSHQYIDKLKKISQIIYKGNIYAHEDIKSELVNIVGGKRITSNMPMQYKTTIHIYGRCGVFGYAVEDEHTMPSQLQQLLLSKGYNDVRVINHGLWGGDDDCIIHNFLQDSGNYKEGDIILFYLKKWDNVFMDELSKYGLYYIDTTRNWHNFPESKWCFYNQPGHMNYVGYMNLAKVIFYFLEKSNFKEKKLLEELAPSSYYINIYHKSFINQSFFDDLNNYLETIRTNYPMKSNLICGSIVMNCNPFTKGHQYLIEYAAARVERLYIFIVEEDRSIFPFKMRLNMVSECTKNYANVIVVPSGKFMISTLTFPEYFLKDYVKEKNFDVSSDLEIFGKFIAPRLNILFRFAGEEPFDVVTANYNESMKRILPSFGIQFIEIPRLKLDENNTISATKVRDFIKNRDDDKIKKYIPDLVYNILKKEFLDV